MCKSDETVIMTFCVDESITGQRLDKALPTLCGDISRSMVQKLLEGGSVTINSKTQSDKNYRLRLGDSIELTMPEPKEIDVIPQPIPLNIVYEDDDVIVINKPRGMVVHPALGNYDGTLVNALLYHCKDSLSGINGVLRPGIVHRIDKDTSGLLVVAKNDIAHKSLAAQIKAHSMTRVYEAVVHGKIKDENGTIDAPIGRHQNERKRMTVRDTNSRVAVTHFEVLERYNGFTHLRLRLETGRTHQIRVHMAFLGHPVAGDMVYGPKKGITSLDGQCLHAKTLGFIHPSSGEYMEFTSELPEYFKKFLSSLTQ